MTTAVPTLADLIADPRRVDDLPPEAIPELRGRLAWLDTLLLMRCWNSNANNGAKSPDALLTPQDVAKRLGRSVDWVQKNAEELNVVRIGEGQQRKALRFTEPGLQRFLKIRGARL